MPSTAQNSELLLVSSAGPAPVQQKLERGRPLTIGRRTSHGLVLESPEVSRDHAEFRPVASADGVRWVLVDLGSRHKTRVNGQELRPGEPCPVQAGDIVEISPWTLRIVAAGGSAGMLSSHERLVRTVDDDLASQHAMRTITAASEELAKERLRLLLSFAEAIGAAADEQALARAVIDAALRGTGFSNAALIRPLMPDGTVSIIADTGEIGPQAGTGDARPPRLSRSLIREASLGQPVQMSSGMMVLPAAHSIVDLKIQDAMCVPLMLEGAAAGFLYLDTRGQTAGKRGGVSPDAGAFAAGLARLAAMALLNLMRRDLEKRYARMEGEISAAASAQRLILPPREMALGPVRIVGECRPGRIVSGDFFDVVELDSGRVAIALGDVAGKGVQASVLMTTTQGFLRGVLSNHGDARRAVTDLNDYLFPRCDAGRFLSLWLGVIDARGGAGTLEYVNAGHGYAWLLGEGGGVRKLNVAGGPLVGVLDGLPYQSATVEFPAGARLLLLSDGIIEQPRGGDREQPFEWDGVQLCLSEAGEPNELVARLFDAVYAHAQQQTLADDATVVVARW